jgi:hypothetical protein
MKLRYAQCKLHVKYKLRNEICCKIRCLTAVQIGSVSYRAENGVELHIAA